jgi:hypothetical protein
MRRCYLKKPLMTFITPSRSSKTAKQIPSTESFLKTLVHLFLRFSRKSFISILLGCFQTFWTHCMYFLHLIKVTYEHFNFKVTVKRVLATALPQN